MFYIYKDIYTNIRFIFFCGLFYYLPIYFNAIKIYKIVLLMSFSASKHLFISLIKILYLIFTVCTMLFFLITVLNENKIFSLERNMKTTQKVQSKPKESFPLFCNINYSDYGLALLLGLFISVKKLRILGTM